MATLPLTFASPDWYTINYIASKMGKNPRTILYWVQRGLFAKMGIQVITVPAVHHAGTKLTWIRIPKGRNYAMFRRVHIDNPPTSNLPLPRNERSI